MNINAFRKPQTCSKLNNNKSNNKITHEENT